MIPFQSLQLEQQPEPQEWTIPEILPRDELLLLDGAPGVGKTAYLASLVASCSEMYPAGQGNPIIVLTARDQRDAFQRFLARNKPEYANIQGIHFPYTQPTRENAGSVILTFIAFLEQLFKEKDIRLFIIDSLEELLAAQTDVITGEYALLWRTLRGLARDYCCSIIVTRRHGFHESRSYGLYTRLGSELAPLAMTMTWHPVDPHKRIITVVKNHDGPIGIQTHVTFKPDGICFISYTDAHEHVRPSNRPATWLPHSHADDVDQEIIALVEASLEDKAKPSSLIKKQVLEAGYSVNAFQRAMGKAKLEKIRSGPDTYYSPSDKMIDRYRERQHALKTKQATSTTPPDSPNPTSEYNLPQDQLADNLSSADTSVIVPAPAPATVPSPTHTMSIIPAIHARTATPKASTLSPAESSLSPRLPPHWPGSSPLLRGS